MVPQSRKALANSSALGPYASPAAAQTAYNARARASSSAASVTSEANLTGMGRVSNTGVGTSTRVAQAGRSRLVCIGGGFAGSGATFADRLPAAFASFSSRFF